MSEDKRWEDRRIITRGEEMIAGSKVVHVKAMTGNGKAGKIV